MHQFNVPQFLDVESKIMGPLTTRQFLILLAAAIIGAIVYRLFDFSLFLVVAVILFLLAITFAFVKINGRPFHFFILNIVQTLRRPATRVWSNRLGFVEGEVEAVFVKPEEKPEPKEFYKKSRLADLSLVVDTKGRYKGDQ